MATRYQRLSFELNLLRVIRDRSAKQSPVTKEELLSDLRAHEALWRYYPILLYELANLLRSDPKQLIEETLESLAELGLVTRAADREETSGFERWQVADSWQPPIPPKSGDGYGGADTPGTPDAGGGDDDGGGGLREALGHPVLFALDKEDFAAMIADIFEPRP